jgi:TonB family protein
MDVPPRSDVYSAAEIALAAGVPVHQVVALVGPHRYVPYTEALRVGQALRSGDRLIFSQMRSLSRGSGVPLAVSSTLHLGLMAAAVFVTTWVGAPTATALIAEQRAEPMRLVFLATPGPGGGGGGGGLVQRTPPPKARREGPQTISSPIPARVPAKPIESIVAPVEPKPPLLNAEPLPILVAPIVTAPADARNRIGVLTETKADTESHGPGRGGGAGSGTGTGLGEGDGRGIGPGSGGGIGGGPYRPGSGIEPPRVVREVKADYSEDARRRGLTGDVVLEIIVRRDGTVGDVKILEGLGAGLNERAVQAVRQWQFAPARRQGTPVDVIVEVAVEFRLR